MNASPKKRLETLTHAQEAPRKRPSWGCVKQVRALTKPRALQLPVCTRPEKKALAAGKAPACLERTWHATRPPKLESLCAWVEPHDLPRLIPDPLFGTCLEDVLNQPPRSSPSRESVAKPTEVPPSSESLTPPHAGTSPNPWETPTREPLSRPRPTRPPRPIHPSYSERAPLTQPAQATLDILTHHAGGHPVSRFFRETRAPRSDFARIAALHSPPKDAVSLPKENKLSRTWQRRLAHRIWQAYRDIPNTTQSSLSPPMPSDGNKNPNLDGSQWITHALAVSPLGRTAPLSLLKRLFEGTITAPESPPQHLPSDESTLQTPSELLRSPAERTASGVPNWDAPFSKTPRGEAPTPILPPPPGAKQGFYPQAGSLPMPAAGQPNFRPPLAPPLASNNTPTLLPPQEVFDAPTPFAAGASRQLAKEDETRLIEEDLDVLAAKIKRILDEEARRHGIQVA